MDQEGEISLYCMQRTLSKSSELLCEFLCPDIILNELLVEGVLSFADKQMIMKKETDNEKVFILLEILTRSPVSSYHVFMKALAKVRLDLYEKVKAIEEREKGQSSRTEKTKWEPPRKRTKIDVEKNLSTSTSPSLPKVLLPYNLFKNDLVKLIPQEAIASLKGMISTQGDESQELREIEDVQSFLSYLERKYFFDSYNLAFLQLLLRLYFENDQEHVVLKRIKQYRASLASRPLFMTDFRRQRENNYFFTEITIQGDIQVFTGKSLDEYREEFAKLLNIETGKVFFVECDGGSIVLLFLLPDTSKKNLEDKAITNRSWFQSFNISRIYIEGHQKYIYMVDEIEGGEDDPDVGKPVNPQSSVRPKEDDRKPSSYSGQPSDDDLDEYMDVAPDSDGDYKKRQIQPARPTKEQLIPKNNYDMKSEVKGLAYILNIKCFKKSKDRLGSDVDFRNMKHLFTELGYEIIHHENLTAEEIRQTIKTFVSKFDDPDSYLSSVVVLMSHGGRGFIVGNDHKRVKLADILADFEGCQNLKGKPKLFFVQACRGKSITLADNLQYDEDMEVDEPIDTDIPNNADIHIAHSTTEGYLSLRSKIKGSWFVQALSEEFLSHAHKDNLDTLMNRVTYRVTEKKGNNWYDYENDMEVTARQTPEVLKRMRKALYFLPKYPPTY